MGKIIKNDLHQGSPAFQGPTLFTVTSSAELEARATELGVTVVHDSIAAQLEELFLLRNPKYKFDPNYTQALEGFLGDKLSGQPPDHYGSWVYFPWSRTLAHYLPEEEWFELRTGRNRNLITWEEQKRFADFRVAIAGLSVGSHIALTLAMTGGAKRMSLADPDVLGPSNMNRVRGRMGDLGRNKTYLVTEQLYELEPYGTYNVYPGGIDEASLGDFLEEADILVEETDKLELKIILREEARKQQIPVVMGTDNGDGIILDVERYDLHPDLHLFNGVVGEISGETFRNFPPHELPKLATRIAGPELAHHRMKDSLLEVGKTIYSWPQLGSAATLCGVAVAFIIRRISNAQPVREGKFAVNLDALIDPLHDTPEEVAKRRHHHDAFMRKIGL